MTIEERKEITDMMWNAGLEYPSFTTLDDYELCVNLIHSLKKLNGESVKRSEVCPSCNSKDIDNSKNGRYYCFNCGGFGKL